LAGLGRYWRYLHGKSHRAAHVLAIPSPQIRILPGDEVELVPGRELAAGKSYAEAKQGLVPHGAEAPNEGRAISATLALWIGVQF
jgi:hypothetical protein